MATEKDDEGDEDESAAVVEGLRGRTSLGSGLAADPLTGGGSENLGQTGTRDRNHVRCKRTLCCTSRALY